MVRYKSVLLFVVMVLVFIITSTIFLDTYAGRQQPENIRTITVYSSAPGEITAVLAQEFEKTYGIRLNVVTIPDREIVTRLALEKSTPRADVWLGDAVSMRQKEAVALLAPFESENTDAIAPRFKDPAGRWTGVWYDMTVLAVNRDYLRQRAKPLTGWSDLTAGQARVAITDFTTSTMSASLLFTMASKMGDNGALSYFKKLHAQVVQYAHFLATPVRMAGMGEADIAVASQNEAIRYIRDGFPLQIIYPQEGTAFFLTAAALTNNAPHPAEAKLFIDWLATKEAQSLLALHGVYFVPTNGETPWPKEFNAHAAHLVSIDERFTTETQAQLLDKWVKDVRLSARQ